MNAPPPSRRFYVLIALALLLLLAASVGSAHLGLGAWSLPVALTIAALKALLVILFFMEVRLSGQVVWLAASLGAVWLLLLVAGTLADYISR